MISNTVTLFRLSLIFPLFFLLISQGAGWPALGLFLGAGLLDIVDGKLARHLNETSALGAMLDLVADRLLTLTAICGLLVHGDWSLLAATCAILIIARDVVTASLGEALGNKHTLKDSRIEHPKIAISFAGLGLTMTPLESLPGITISAHALGEMLIVLAAILTLITLVDYFCQTITALRKEPML